jgi:isopenicillin N synthase-like dioxygenase
MWPAPDIVNRNRSLLKSFITSSHSIVTLVLELLNEHLRLPPDTLPGLHRLYSTSGDHVRFIKAPPQPVDDRRVALGEHTDFGSVTVLFNRLGGLQVLPPGRDAQWCYVKPLPGHAIINLGDAMVKFTNGVLRSNIHRVASPPGAQGDHTRYSLVYFCRPEDDVVLKRLEGSDMIPPLADGEEEEEVKSKDWIIRRALGNRVVLHKDAASAAADWDKSLGTEQKSQRAYL